MASNGITARRIFHRIWIAGKKSLVKRAPGWLGPKLASMLLPRDGAFDLGLAVSVPLPIVTGIFVLLWFQSRLT